MISKLFIFNIIFENPSFKNKMSLYFFGRSNRAGKIKKGINGRMEESYTFQEAVYNLAVNMAKCGGDFFKKDIVIKKYICYDITI